MTLKADGYIVQFTNTAHDGSRITRTLTFDTNPLQHQFSRKADANKAAFEVARQWRSGRSIFNSLYRQNTGRERVSGFTAVQSACEVPGGRAFLLKAANSPWAKVVVRQNFKEVSK